MSDELSWKTVLNDKGEPKDFLVDREKTNYLEANRNLLAITEKISSKMLQSMGLLPALAPSVFVQQFIQVNNSQVIPDQFRALFTPEGLAKLSDTEAIDVDYSELEGGEE
jgi:hypothetical protein